MFVITKYNTYKLLYRKHAVIRFAVPRRGYESSDFMISKWLSIGNLKAAALALLLFVYPILALSTASIRYLETIHRITNQQTFDQSVFGSTSGDSTAVLGFFLLFLAVAFRSSVLRIAMIIVFGAGIGTFLAGYEQILLIAGLATLPILAALLLASALSRNRRSLSATQQTKFSLSGFQLDGKRVAVLFLTIIIILEIGALARWVAYPIFPSEMYGDPSWKIAELESALFHVFGLLSPVILLLLAFSFLYKDYIRSFIRKLSTHQENEEDAIRRQAKSDIKRAGSHEFETEHAFSGSNIRTAPEQGTSALIMGRSAKLSQKPAVPHMAILIGAMIISIVITLYPHFPGVNQSGTGVSTDEQAYIRWLAEVRNFQSQGLATTSPEVISTVFTDVSDRPLSILLMLVVSDLTAQSDANVVRFLPVFLAPALVLTSYCFVRYGYPIHDHDHNGVRKKEKIAAIVAVTAALSPQIVVGVYGGFLANWLALIPGFLALLFAARISDYAPRVRNNGSGWKWAAIHLLCFFATLTLTMLFHVYTWGFVVLVSLMFAFFSYYSMRKSNAATRGDALKIMGVLVGVIVVSIATDVAKSSYFSVTSGFARDTFLAESSFRLENFNSKWETIDFTLTSYVGGYLSHPGLLLLALIWVSKANYFRAFDRLIFSILFVLTIPILFGTSEIQARLFYLVPLFVPAVLALYELQGEKSTVLKFAVVAIVASMAVYILRAMANLYLVLPEGYELDKPFLAP